MTEDDIAVLVSVLECVFTIEVIVEPSEKKCEDDFSSLSI